MRFFFASLFLADSGSRGIHLVMKSVGFKLFSVLDSAPSEGERDGITSLYSGQRIY